MKSKYIYLFIPLALLILTLTIYYYPVLSRLLAYLSNNDDYSYGLIIPLVSGYIIYQKWPQIQQSLWRPSWWGVIIIMIALCLYIIGEIAADLYVPRISFVISLFGLVILIGGWRLARLLMFPLCLLL